MTREQAAEKWHNDRYVKMLPSPFPFDKYNHTKQGYEDFLAGCEHADKEHREFYLAVRTFVNLNGKMWKAEYDSQTELTPQEAKEFTNASEIVRKHLTAFTEREQQQLPFKH